MSLSSNASFIKYMLKYKDLDPNAYYDFTNTDVTFKPIPNWWFHKCSSYHNQDEATTR